MKWNWSEEEEKRGGVGRKRGGVVADFLPEGRKQAEEPVGSAGSSRARPSSRKALSAVIHYSATSTISLCQAIFTSSDKIDSMYKRMRDASPPRPLPRPAHHHLFIYLSR